VLKVRSPIFRYALRDFGSGSNGIASGRPWRWHRFVFRATDFHFRHHVFCDDPAAKETPGAAAEIGFESEEW
jgi:hypothetical protein